MWNIVAWQTYLEASENYVRQVCVCLGEGRGGASNGRVGNDIGQVVVGGKVVVSALVVLSRTARRKRLFLRHTFVS